jgi:hypothetical protein
MSETTIPRQPHDPNPPTPVMQPVALVDLLDRVLATGVVITGEVTLSLAGIDLVYVSLRALLSSVGPSLLGVEPTAEDVGGFVDRAVEGGEPAP